MNVSKVVRNLHRPASLVQTARYGARNFPRDRLLDRVLPFSYSDDPEANLIALLEHEETLNALRLSQNAGYILRDHIETLMAIVTEHTILNASVDA